MTAAALISRRGIGQHASAALIATIPPTTSRSSAPARPGQIGNACQKLPGIDLAAEPTKLSV